MSISYNLKNETTGEVIFSNVIIPTKIDESGSISFKLDIMSLLENDPKCISLIKGGVSKIDINQLQDIKLSDSAQYNVDDLFGIVYDDNVLEIVMFMDENCCAVSPDNLNIIIKNWINSDNVPKGIHIKMIAIDCEFEDYMVNRKLKKYPYVQLS